MVKKSKEALKNALIQAEKHGVSDTFYLSKSDKGFYVSYSRDKREYELIFDSEMCSIRFKYASWFMEFLEVL